MINIYFFYKGLNQNVFWKFRNRSREDLYPNSTTLLELRDLPGEGGGQILPPPPISKSSTLTKKIVK